MKRLLRIFELTINEQRVVLIVVFVLLAIAFVGYERRVHLSLVGRSATERATPSPSPVEIEGKQ
jgi:hypothetical protein